MSLKVEDHDELRDLSWVGDAALGLCAREWIIQHEGRLRGRRDELYRDLTSNRFLSSIGSPTQVEARMGDIYCKGGIAAVREFFERELVPVFLRQAAKRRRKGL